MREYFKEDDRWFREKFREEFARTVRDLGAVPLPLQALLGRDLLLARRFFLDHFDNEQSFLARTMDERLGFVMVMVEMEDRLAEEGSSASFAFGLYRMWVCALAQKDDELCEEFSSALDHFMEIGREAGLGELGEADQPRRH